MELTRRNAGRVLTRPQLIAQVWGPGYVGDMRTLDVHIKRIRHRIKAYPAVGNVGPVRSPEPGPAATKNVGRALTRPN